MLDAIRRAMRPVGERFGLRVVNEEHEGNYVAVVYRNDTTGIRVAVDWSELRVFVTLYELTLDGFPDEPTFVVGGEQRRAFDADDLLLMRAPSPSPVGKMLSGRDNDAAERLVGEYADALGRSAADVLSGDFTVFKDLNEIVRRRERDLR